MAAHKRKEIRAAYKGRLLNATSCEDRVFTSRLAPISLQMLTDEGPALLIYVRDETINPDDYSTSGENGVAKRHIEITVEIVARGSSTVDDVLDDIATEVEEVLEGWDIPGLSAACPRLTESELDVSDAFESPVGSCSLTYAFSYYTAFNVTPEPVTPVALFSAPQAPGVPRELLLGTVDGETRP